MLHFVKSRSSRTLRLPILMTGAFAAALMLPAVASAEKLIVVTPTQLRQIDTSAPSAVLQSLPFSGLPANAQIIGADFGPIDSRLYLLVRLSTGNCTTLVMNSDNGALSSAGLRDWSGCPAGTRDYERLRHEDARKIPDQIVALGNELGFHDPNESDGWQRWSVQSAGGGVAAVIATAAENRGDSSVNNPKAVVGIELNTRALVTVVPKEDSDDNVTVTVTPIGSLGISPTHFAANTNTSLDRTLAGTLYLLIDGGLYSVNDNTGAATSLGNVPAGAIAVLEDRLADGDPSGCTIDCDEEEGGGGSFGWLTVLGLLPAALLRRRLRSSAR